MRFEKLFIPYGCYWSTPFCKWQGSFSNLHPLLFAADTARRALAARNMDAGMISSLYLGFTVPSPHCFYGAPWVAGLIGAPCITGPTISQACATSARVIQEAGLEIEAGGDARTLVLGITADRTSNGPHLVYPGPLKPGGTMESEDWVWGNFNCDPLGNNSMIETAEKVAGAEKISTEEQHEVVLLRHRQYQEAVKDDFAFQKRYMISPVEVRPAGKLLATVVTDEGVYPTTMDRLKKLKPVLPGGTVTYGGQTYPADGNAGMLLTGRERARELSLRLEVEVQVIATGAGRAEQSYMPKANLPAVQKALAAAGLTIKDMGAIKTHNPFVVNDIYLARELGLKAEEMNNYGSSLIWGHPQGPTGMRLIIELIEELVIRGGGFGLFTGCAAGDSAMAVIVQVRARK
ncbi:MAG: thiolase family protein [Acidobacteria bacterium]|nr:thiolase family protein [Acidobacteriota bacterium]